MEKDFNPKLIPDYSDGIKQNKQIDRLSFEKRKIILSKEELNKLDDLYKKYVDTYSVEIGFVDKIELEISKNGLFDVVVLDSVLNSVTITKMQHNVLLTCNSLLKDDCVLVLGTRCLGHIECSRKSPKSTNDSRDIEFLDYDNYSVTFRKGVWTKQRFNTKENLSKELSPFFEDVEILGSETRSNIYAICKKPIRWSLSDYKTVLNTEFNMTYPNGSKHNKHTKLVETILKALF